jgi:hypothetical protein
VDCGTTFFVVSAKSSAVRVGTTFLPVNKEEERLAATPESVRHRSISRDTDRVDDDEVIGADQLNEEVGFKFVKTSRT